MHTRVRILVAAFAAFSLLVSSVPSAQEWPTKTVRFISPFPPGGTNDVMARLLADRLTKALGAPFVVENRTGAGGSIGNAYVAKADPDGYTILMGSTSIAIYPSLVKDSPYRLFEELTPAAVVATVPNMVAIHPSVPAKTLREFISYAKANPAAIFYGSGGNGQVGHLAAELLKARTGIQMTHIPYKGNAPAVAELLAGRIQIVIENAPALLPHVRSGTLRALAVTTPERFEEMPDVPTVIEAGVPDYTATAWQSVWLPAGAPAPVLRRLSDTIVKIMSEPEVQATVRKYGAFPVVMGSNEAMKFTRSEFAKWADVIKVAGVKVD